MQIKVVYHMTGKITTGNGCISLIFNISINIWSRETKLTFFPSNNKVFQYTEKYPMH